MATSSAQSSQATANFSFVPPAGLLDPSHPYFLNPGDNPASALVTVVFNGNNYYAWARSMRLALLAKKKLSLIDPAVAPPFPGDPLHGAWERCNVMVLGWIYRSLAPDIAHSVLWFDSAVEVWRDLQDRFSEASLIRISDLQDEVFAFKQGAATVSEYFTRFRVLWDELVTIRPFPACSCTPRCSCGALNVVRLHQQSDQIIRFLKGLNDSFSQIRSQILLMEPLPPITRVFSMVIQHEQQLHSSSAPSVVTPMAMAGRSSGPSQGQGRGAGQKQRPVCTHCGGVGHTVDRCFKKHGYPPGYKGKGKVNAAIADEQAPSSAGVPSGESVVLTSEQYHTLLAQAGSASASSSVSCLMSGQPSSSSVQPSSSFDQPGSSSIQPSSSGPAAVSTSLWTQPNQLAAYAASGKYTLASIPPERLGASINTWIIDSGATDHVACSLDLFVDFTPLSGMFVTLPNGSRIAVTHKGSVRLSNTLTA
ncbi:unnamed protein product [Linum trigynum]|uniref:Retrotransposon Copia-like N-terminal domain-containing protein n=1 Tax=Linum trigynum TaxID=586398 RepID=A0AAV2F0I1_9ROSI